MFIQCLTFVGSILLSHCIFRTNEKLRLKEVEEKWSRDPTHISLPALHLSWDSSNSHLLYVIFL